jgi:hypothetical protein
MPESSKDRTRRHKQVSSIFKGVPVPQAGRAQRPSPGAAPQRIVPAGPKSSSPKQRKPAASKVDKSSQALPQSAPAAQPEASPGKKPEVVPAAGPRGSAVKLPKPTTAHEPKTGPAENKKVTPLKRQRPVPAKKQKTVKIQYLKTAGVIWAVCFAVFLVAYLFVLGPQKKEKRRIRQQLEEKKQLVESALTASKNETKAGLNEQIERLRTRMQDFVVDFEDSANLTFEISQIASQKQVDSFSIKGKENPLSTGKKESRYINENHIVISFIGGFSQFATFLNALERHRPVLLVDKFSISRSQQDELAFRVNLNVAALVRKQQDKKTTDKRSQEVYGMKI